MAGIDGNVLLYLRGDSAKDLSRYNNTITNNTSTIAAEGPFGKAISMGSGKYMHIVCERSIGADEDFTFEWYEIYDSYAAGACTFSNGGDYFLFGHVAASMMNQYACWSGTSPSTGWMLSSLVFNQAQATWVHRAIVRQYRTYTTYTNGVKVATQTCSGGIPLNLSTLYINNRQNCGGHANDIRICNFRLSNVARYTSNFNPPGIFNSINMNITNQTDNAINFTVSKTGKEVINKVEVLINNQLSQTYNNIGDLTYTPDEKIMDYGNNDVLIRVTYDNDYTEEIHTTHTKKVVLEDLDPLPELPSNATLGELIQRFSIIDSANLAIYNNLKELLKSKGFNIGENPRLSNMIKLVNELSNNNSTEITEYINRIAILEDNIDNNRRSLCTALINKNIPCSEEDSFETLVSYINSFEPYSSKVYLYDNGDMCTSTAGGWVFSTSGRPVDNTGYTLYAPVINSNYIYMGEKTSNTYGITQMKTKNAINVTDYNSLNVDATLISAYNDGYNACSTFIEVYTASPNLTYWNHANDTGTTKIKAAENASTTLGRRTLTLDVSSITGNVYILIKVYSLWSVTQYREEHIHRIWLE